MKSLQKMWVFVIWGVLFDVFSMQARMFFLNRTFCARRIFCWCRIFCEPWRKNLNSFKPCVSFAQNRWKYGYFFWISTENWALGRKIERRPYVFLLEMWLETFEDKFENIRGIGSIDCCTLACVEARQQFFTPLFDFGDISKFGFRIWIKSLQQMWVFVIWGVFFYVIWMQAKMCFRLGISGLVEYSVVVEYSASLDVKTWILCSHV